MLSRAGALNRQATAPITPDAVSTFLNPYQGYITGALNRNLQQNVLPEIQDKFVSAGQSRSPQEAELTARAAQGTQTAIGESLAGGYQGALNSLLQQRQTQLSGAGQAGQLGALGSQLGAVDVGQLAASGQSQDQIAQANINSAMQQFQQQQQWPYQNVGFLSDVVRGLPVNSAGLTTQTVGMTYPGGANYNPSPAGSALSTALGARSLGFRRGGPVPNVGALSRLRMAA